MLEVVAANRNNPFVVTIAIKQVFAKRKKARLGEAIVLENNCLFHVPENPFQATGDSVFTPHIFGGVIGEYFTRPIDGINDLTRCADSLIFSRTIRTGCITYHKEFTRLCACNCLKDPLRRIRSIEDQKTDWSLCSQNQSANSGGVPAVLAKYFHQLSGY